MLVGYTRGSTQEQDLGLTAGQFARRAPTQQNLLAIWLWCHAAI